MKKFATILLLLLECISISSVVLVLNTNAYVYDKQILTNAFIVNTLDEDIVSTRLITNANYSSNDSVQLRNVNYQFPPSSLYPLTTQTNDLKYNKDSNTTTNVTSVKYVSFIPDFLLYQRQLKQRDTEFQAIFTLKSPLRGFNNNTMSLAYQFYDINDVNVITINFSCFVQQFGVTEELFYANTTQIDIITDIENKTSFINATLLQLTTTPIIISVKFTFNSIDLMISRTDYRYLEYQNSNNASVIESISDAPNIPNLTHYFKSIIYYHETFVFNYIDINTVLSKLHFQANFDENYDFTDINSDGDTNEIALNGMDSSLITPFSVYVPLIITNQQILYENFIEDTLFFHNRCDEFYNYYFDTTDLELLRNPLVFNVTASNTYTNQLRYIGNYTYASNESINLFVTNSNQNLSSSVYQRNVALPTWESQTSTSFVYTSNKTYYPDSQLDCFHIYYQTNCISEHNLSLTVFGNSFTIGFTGSTTKLLRVANVTHFIEYQNSTFRNFDIYIYPVLKSDGNYYLHAYVEYYAQQIYFDTNIPITLYGQRFSNTVEITQIIDLQAIYICAIENLNLYRGYSSTQTIIHRATKQYQYRCVYESILHKKRDFSHEIYSNVPLMQQISTLKGYYFDKIAIFNQLYTTDHISMNRLESQLVFDFANTTLDCSFTNNESYQIMGAMIDSQSLSLANAKIISIYKSESETVNITPNTANIPMPKLSGSFHIMPIGVGMEPVVETMPVTNDVFYTNTELHTVNTPNQLNVGSSGSALISPTGSLHGGIGQTVQNVITHPNDPLAQGWTTVINNTLSWINNTFHDITDTTPQFNIVVISASTILQYDNISVDFNVMSLITTIGLPIVILVLFVFLLKRFHTKLAVLGFFFGIIMLYVMELITIKIAIVISILFIIFGYVYYTSLQSNRSDQT